MTAHKSSSIERVKNIFREVAENAVKGNASDIHLRAGSHPIVRHQGTLRILSKFPVLSHEELRILVEEELLSKENRPKLIRILVDHGEVDFSYMIKDLARFRVNAYLQRGKYSVVLRIIPHEIPDIAALNLPEIINEVASRPRGLILITGAAGNGKSTTMAAMVEHINKNASRHIITIEDPIEFYYQDKNSIIDQRELYVDTQDFNNALEKALRQDPDVIVIGEMRDRETVRVALSAAETGHLVLSTLHTIGAAETFDRIIDYFPPHEQDHARMLLANSLQAIISQRLVPHRKSRHALIPATEIFVATARARQEILRGIKGDNLLEIIEQGDYYKMHSFDRSLMELVKNGDVTVDDALSYATRPEDFNLRLETENITNAYTEVIDKNDESEH